MFASYRVRGAILDAVRKESSHRHALGIAVRAAASRYLEVQAHGGDVLSDTEADCRKRLEAFSDGLVATMFATVAADARRAPTTEDTLGDAEARALALRALAEASSDLPLKERALLEQHYEQGLDLKVVAANLGVGYATIRRWHLTMLGRLAVRLRARGVHEAPA